METSDGEWGFVLRDAVITALDNAVRALSLLEQDPSHAVHEARVKMKQVRAGLDLAAGAVRGLDPIEEPIVLAAGARLGPVRDQHVAEDLRVAAAKTDRVPPALGPMVRSLVAASQVSLVGVRQRLGDLEGWDGLTVEHLTLRLDRSEQTMRARLNRAVTTCKVPHLHRARVAVKRLEHQYRLLGILKGRSSRLAELDALLGDHHDAATLGHPTPGQLIQLEVGVADATTRLMRRPADERVKRIERRLLRGPGTQRA